MRRASTGNNRANPISINEGIIKDYLARGMEKIVRVEQHLSLFS